MLTLDDLEGWKEAEILEHLSENYAGKTVSTYNNNYEISEEEKFVARQTVEKLRVLIAQEYTNTYRQADSYFLLQDLETEVLYEVYGNHCSCHKFQGQLRLERTSFKALKSRLKKTGTVLPGLRESLWDDDDEASVDLIDKYVRDLLVEDFKKQQKRKKERQRNHTSTSTYYKVNNGRR